MIVFAFIVSAGVAFGLWFLFTAEQNMRKRIDSANRKRRLRASCLNATRYLHEYYDGGWAFKCP